MEAREPSSSPALPAAVERERRLMRSEVRTADVLHTFKDKVTFGDVDAKGNFTPNPEGRKYQIDISDAKSRATYREMRKKRREVAVGVQHEKSAELNPVKMYDRTGKARLVSERIADTEGRKSGFRVRNGESFSMRRPRHGEGCPGCGEWPYYCECPDE